MTSPPFLHYNRHFLLLCRRIASILLLLLVASPPHLLCPTSATGRTFSWEELDTQLPKPISDHTATRVGQVVYLAGGCDAKNGNKWDEEARRFSCSRLSQSFYSFDLSDESNTTTILPDMPVPRYRHAAVAVKNKLFIVGGRNVNDSIVEQVDVSVPFVTWFGRMRCQFLNESLT